MINNVQALIIRGLDTRYKIRNRGELKAIVHSRHKQLNWSLSPKGQGLHYLYERARPWGTLGVGFAWVLGLLGCWVCLGVGFAWVLGLLRCWVCLGVGFAWVLGLCMQIRKEYKSKEIKIIA
jgi:hypothetical protein